MDTVVLSFINDNATGQSHLFRSRNDVSETALTRMEMMSLVISRVSRDRDRGIDNI